MRTNICAPGPTLDASNDFLFDLQKKQVEKNLTLDLADEDIFSNPEVKRRF